MNTRRAYVDLIYNGTAATAEISGFVTDISYTDPASGEADSLDITLQDRDRRWTGAWIPVAGDTLAATIRALNCQYSGDNRVLPGHMEPSTLDRERRFNPYMQMALREQG